MFQYWIAKYMLLRKHKTPESLGNEIDLIFRKMIPFIIFLSSLGQFTFIRTLSNIQNTIIFIPLLTCFVYFIWPVRFLFDFIENRSVERSDDILSYQYMFEYEHANPVKFQTIGNSDTNKGRFCIWVIDLDAQSEVDQSSKLTSKIINFETLMRYGLKSNVLKTSPSRFTLQFK